MSPFISSLLGFALNFGAVILIVRFIYYPQQREKNFVFTFIAFNTVVYFVMGLLNNASVSVGVGFGLFAIFSLLRYRTETMPIREMTYLFIVIALPVLNAVLISSADYGQLALVNAAIIGLLYVLERGWGFRYESRKSITYERIDLIRPENWDQLLADLQARTGLPISRVEVGRINFLRDSVDLYLYYEADALKSSRVRMASNHVAPDDGDR